jgi:glycine betaine catabolism B
MVLSTEGSTMAAVKVGKVSDFSTGTRRVVQAGDKTLALFNLGGTFYALDNRCTHKGGPLAEGTVDGNQVKCPWHGSIFDVTTGEVIGPPARQPVATFRVHVERDEVLIEIP